MNALKALTEYGQAVWLDFLARRFVAEGGLARLVDQDGLTGVTSNPSIFEKAIGGSADYDEALAAAAESGDADVPALYRAASRSPISGMPPMSCGRSTTPAAVATASSASKSRPISPSTPRPPSPKRGGSGARSPATI